MKKSLLLCWQADIKNYDKALRQKVRDIDVISHKQYCLKRDLWNFVGIHNKNKRDFTWRLSNFPLQQFDNTKTADSHTAKCFAPTCNLHHKKPKFFAHSAVKMGF